MSFNDNKFQQQFLVEPSLVSVLKLKLLRNFKKFKRTIRTSDFFSHPFAKNFEHRTFTLTFLLLKFGNRPISLETFAEI